MLCPGSPAEQIEENLMCIAMNNIVVINKIAVKIERGNTPLALFFSFSSFRVYFVHVLAMTKFRYLGFKKASPKIAYVLDGKSQRNDSLKLASFRQLVFASLCTCIMRGITTSRSATVISFETEQRNI